MSRIGAKSPVHSAGPNPAVEIKRLLTNATAIYEMQHQMRAPKEEVREMRFPGFSAEISVYENNFYQVTFPRFNQAANAVVLAQAAIALHGCKLVPSVLCFSRDPLTGWGTGLCDPNTGYCSPCYWDGSYVVDCSPTLY